ncbi:uncharacterized protein MYCGRDRAFT_103703 [Zymoseptoria tritici IPO323]|uniref:Uncharacterized protein n=1 Tax=Zymoseptoria tritici (strain CBS 115943 / IPO323) TaxID=336722 RepID=F9X509_ZYMTI|nr:uncharacterized protein MYCGRDRAFT_103703 [Zymoseptoria tritici IPO323]EGP88800.1 hypothetical protein MYCGRDRAFT_103703 [Zymoseptoria tritici IPO323]
MHSAQVDLMCSSRVSAARHAENLTRYQGLLDERTRSRGLRAREFETYNAGPGPAGRPFDSILAARQNRRTKSSL